MVAPTISATQSAHRTVLIVEDERVSRRALAALLASYGYSTSAVSSAEEAVKLLRGGTLPSIAVVDLDLPGMSGLELIALLEKLDPGVYPVLVTGADSDRLEIALRDRHVDYLRKPVNFHHLLALIDAKEARN